MEVLRPSGAGLCVTLMSVMGKQCVMHCLKCSPMSKKKKNPKNKQTKAWINMAVQPSGFSLWGKCQGSLLRPRT